MLGQFSLSNNSSNNGNNIGIQTLLIRELSKIIGTEDRKYAVLSHKLNSGIFH